MVAILTGGYLGHSVRAGSFGTAEKILAAGALAALIAVVEHVGVPSFLVLGGGGTSASAAGPSKFLVRLVHGLADLAEHPSRVGHQAT